MELKGPYTVPRRVLVLRSLKLAVAALAIGVVVGAATVVLGLSVEAAYGAFTRWEWLAWLLPLIGVLSLALYRCLHVSIDENTTSVIEASRRSKPVPLALAPAIFAGTCLTVACGGSVGKEAAALQLGGSIASTLGSRFGLHRADYQATFIMCGLAAALSAVLFAPFAAFVFTVEVMHRRFPHPFRLPAVFLSSLVAYGIARTFGHGWMGMALPDLSGAEVPLLQVALLGIAAAAVGGAFCVTLRVLRRTIRKVPINPYLSIAIGGVIVAALVLFAGMRPYSGTGSVQIVHALTGEPPVTTAFLGKFVLTLLTLAFGFKGGEVMPVLCIGACLGTTYAGLTQTSTAWMAAVGMVALFSACTNCPFASCILGLELFGVEAAPYFAIAAAVAFVFSYRCSLYQSACIDWTPRGIARQTRRWFRTRHRGKHAA